MRFRKHRWLFAQKCHTKEFLSIPETDLGLSHLRLGDIIVLAVVLTGSRDWAY